MKYGVAIAGLFVLQAAAGVAWSMDFASVTSPSAILYDAPSTKGHKLYVVSRYMPLERVISLKDWVKVRDETGKLAWIEKSALGNVRYVVVTATLADVHQSPDSTSALVFRARKQVALEWLEDTNTGWIKVRHQDGATGYVRVADVWGS